MIRRPVLAFAVCVTLALFAAPEAPAQETEELLQALETLEALGGAEMLQDPEHVMAWVTVPKSVSKGDAVVLKLSVENARADREIRLSYVNITDEFLDGFKIVSIDPEPRNQDHSLGSLTLEYPVDIPPGETWEWTLNIRAEKKGVFIGDVDVYEGEQFLTRAAQTRID